VLEKQFAEMDKAQSALNNPISELAQVVVSDVSMK
jgi:hypothetical protein